MSTVRYAKVYNGNGWNFLCFEGGLIPVHLCLNLQSRLLGHQAESLYCANDTSDNVLHVHRPSTTYKGKGLPTLLFLEVPISPCLNCKKQNTVKKFLHHSFHRCNEIFLG